MNLATLPTESRNPATEHIDELPTLDMLRLINNEDAKVAQAVAAVLPDIAKAVDEIAGLLFPHAAEVVFTEPGTSRAISASQLSEIAAHLAARSSVIPDAEQAFDYLVSKARPEDAVFVTGSLYLVGRLRHYWKQRAQVAAG